MIDVSIKEYVAIEKERLKNRIAKHPDFDYHLDIFQIGDHEASNRYIRGKIKDCDEIGIRATLHKYDDGFDYDDVVDNMSMVISNAKGNGAFLLQLPVPLDIYSYVFAGMLNKWQDVDGFKPDSAHYPCTAQGIIDWLEYNDYHFDGGNAVVIGRSEIVGRPIAKMLLDHDMNVTVCHSRTYEDDLQKYIENADLIVSAVGKPKFLKYTSKIKGSVTIDVGISFDENGKMCGDVDSSVFDKAGAYHTPVPGGVGLLTRVALLGNIVNACGYTHCSTDKSLNCCL